MRRRTHSCSALKSARARGKRVVGGSLNSINTHDGIGASVLICCLFISTFNTNKQAQQTKPSACAFLHLKKSTLPLNVLPPRECPSLVRDPPDGESGYLDALHLPSVAAIVAATSVRSPRGNWFKKVHQLVGVKPAHERFCCFVRRVDCVKTLSTGKCAIFRRAGRPYFALCCPNMTDF